MLFFLATLWGIQSHLASQDEKVEWTEPQSIYYDENYGLMNKGLTDKNPLLYADPSSQLNPALRRPIPLNPLSVWTPQSLPRKSTDLVQLDPWPWAYLFGQTYRLLPPPSTVHLRCHGNSLVQPLNTNSLCSTFHSTFHRVRAPLHARRSVMYYHEFEGGEKGDHEGAEEGNNKIFRPYDDMIFALTFLDAK